MLLLLCFLLPFKKIIVNLVIRAHLFYPKIFTHYIFSFSFLFWPPCGIQSSQARNQIELKFQSTLPVLQRCCPSPVPQWELLIHYILLFSHLLPTVWDLGKQYGPGSGMSDLNTSSAIQQLSGFEQIMQLKFPPLWHGDNIFPTT